MDVRQPIITCTWTTSYEARQLTQRRHPTDDAIAEAFSNLPVLQPFHYHSALSSRPKRILHCSQSGLDQNQSTCRSEKVDLIVEQAKA